MDKNELIKKIREIEITSNAFSNHVFSGEYRSYFKGNGMEFSSVRRYTEGDDVKKIDWKVSAKQRKTYVKEYVEERELLVYIMVDISNSSILNKGREFLTLLTGILSFSAVKNGDKVGLVLFTDKIEKILIAKKGRKHALAMLEEVYSYEGMSNRTDIANTLKEFTKHIKKRAIVIMLSDFLDKGFEDEVRRVSGRHDFIPIRIKDSNYEELPKGFVFRFEDSESGKEVYYESREDLNIYDDDFKHRNLLELNMEDDYLKKLTLYFKKRRR